MESSMLSPREEQQLAISLKSRRIREIALTVCTIRPLALEVKSILDDLFPTGPQVQIQNFSGFQVPFDVNMMSRNTVPITGAGRRKRQYRCNVCFVSFRSHIALIQHKSLNHRHANTVTTSQTPADSIGSMSSPSKTASNEIYEQEASSTVPQTVTSTRNTSTPRTTNSDSEPHHNLTSDENDSRSVNRERTPSSPPVIQSTGSADTPEHPPSEPTIKMEVIPISTTSQPMWPSEGNMSDDSLRSSGTPSTPANRQTTASPPVISLAHSLPTMPQLSTQSIQPPASGSGDQNADGLFGCPDCDFITTTRSGMQQHVAFVHGQRKPYACKQCHYSTDKKWLLTRHFLVHTGEKPHKCEVCDFGSIDHISLVKHMELKHADIKPHTCTACGTHTYTKTLLKRHMKENHCDVPYSNSADKVASRMNHMNRNPNPLPVRPQTMQSVSSVAWGSSLFPPR